MPPPPPNVLVFGASGWIGSAIAEALIASDFRVTGVFRSEPPADLSERGMTSVLGDLANLAPLLDEVRTHDAVVFAASAPSVITEQALRMLAASGAAKRLVFISGSSIYGSTSHLIPVGEDARLAPPLPVSYLPLHEELAMLASPRTCIFRGAPILYGRSGGATPPFLLADAVLHGAARYIASGEQRWSACHVDDLARLVALALSSESPSGIFNAVTHDYSLADVSRIVAKRIGPLFPTALISKSQASAEWGAFWAELLSASLFLSSERAVATFGWREQSPQFEQDINDYLMPS